MSGDSRPSQALDHRMFQRELRSLKKDFQRNVLPAVKRNRYHLSKSEMRRLKERKAARRLRRQQRKQQRLGYGR